MDQTLRPFDEGQMVGEAALEQHTNAMVTGKIGGSDHIFPAQKPTAARVGRKVRMSRPIRKSIAFSSPLLLGIPLVQKSEKNSRYAIH